MNVVLSIFNQEVAGYLHASELLNYYIAVMNKKYELQVNLHMNVIHLQRWMKNLARKRGISLVVGAINAPVTMKLVQGIFHAINCMYKCKVCAINTNIRCISNAVNCLFTCTVCAKNGKIESRGIQIVTSYSAHKGSKAVVNYKINEKGISCIEANGSSCTCNQCGKDYCSTCNNKDFTRCQHCALTICEECVYHNGHKVVKCSNCPKTLCDDCSGEFSDWLSYDYCECGEILCDDCACDELFHPFICCQY